MAQMLSPIMNEKFKNKILSKNDAHYYLAADRDEGTLFFWAEARVLWKTVCYPYYIRGDELVQFINRDNQNNVLFNEKWVDLINAKKVKEQDFAVLRLQGEDVHEVADLLVDMEADLLPLYKRLGIDLFEE